jgi:TIR domain
VASSSPKARGRIFINYRRQDTAYAAGWLFERISARYGDDQIFKDVDSIELGDDFVEVIAAAVGHCDVLLALIGKDWLTITGADGKPRIDDPEDFVRLEIEAALGRGILVIPLLVDGAHMPHTDQLPPSLAPLAHRQALELSPARFDFDTNRLLTLLDEAVADASRQEQPASPQEPRARRFSRRALVIAGAAAGALVLATALALVLVLGSNGPAEATASPESLDTVVFQDDFADRSGGWDDAAGRRNGGHYTAGTYRLYSKWNPNHWSESALPRTATSVFPTAPRDVRVTVDAQPVVTGPNVGYGLLCRANAGGVPSYRFMIWPSWVAIEKVIPSDPFYEQLATGNLSALRPDGTNRLQAVCVTDGSGSAKLTFSVNGREVASATDSGGRAGPPLTTGSVGLVVANDEGSKAIDARFDDFAVAGD